MSKSRYYIFLCLCFVFGILSSDAQIPDGIERDISAKKMKDRAAFAAKTGDVYSALFYYQAIILKDSNDLDAVYQLAEMHRYSRNYKKAEEVYSKVFLKSPGRYPIALYYKGLMQKMNGKYEEGKKNMLQFKKESKNLDDKDFVSILTKEIAGCDSGITYREFPDNVVIENAGNSVNHPHTEFSPFLLDSNNMIFGSLRMDSLAFFDIFDNQYEKQPVRQVYKAERSDGKWEEKGKYEIFNDPHAEMGNFVYSAYSGKYFFSKCSKSDMGIIICKIYSIEKVDGKWSQPELLPFPVNVEGYTSTQPALVLDSTTIAVTNAGIKKTPDKQDPKNKNAKVTNKPVPKPTAIEYLYFVSDRPGGRGGLDIWNTSYNRTRKEWSRPVNFSVVNTSATECTPFYHTSTQSLYFSSNGYPTAGGLDIFKIKKEGKKYSKVKNLSFPINSSQDELGFMVNQEGKKGVFVSNRPGGTPYFHETCCDDIYAFEIMPPVKAFICKLDLSLVDPDTSGCAPNQMMKIISFDVQNMKDRIDSVIIPDCKYQMTLEKNYNYKFLVEREGYQKDTLTLETRETCISKIILKKLLMNKAKKEEIAIINEVPKEGKTFVLNDIQYEFNQSSLTAPAMAALDSVLIPFLKEYPNDKLMINSHTDDQGSHKYNHMLSQQRAESVVKYLVSKGVDPARLHAKGYGETKPLMPNQNPDGTDNPFGRLMNRRTDFLLLKENEKKP
jgi:OOP family OmpA-OmpF porin